MMAGDQRVAARHLQRGAVVYARQSSPHQLLTHAESTRVQRGLGDLALALGWTQATVIDDDLGTSAGGYADRPGFRQMLTQVATRKVGILLCLDASRLARNSPDWAHLFQLCGHFDTLVADLTQVYDLALPNDRLVLGIKAVISEMELATMRLRMRTGAESKAARGELKEMLPAAYEHDHAGRIVMNADRRVREAIAHVFEEFDRVTSLRQLAMNYWDSRTRIPVRRTTGERSVVWVVPTIATITKIVKNPIYAGAYVWGRSKQVYAYEDGVLRKRSIRNLPIAQAKVFIPEHHPAYISWERFEANQARLADNRVRWNKEVGVGDNRGAIRRGAALLAGLLRCGHCGRRMVVSYAGKTAVYRCNGGFTTHAGRCLSLGAVGLDRSVGRQLCQALQPASIQAAADAEELRAREHEQHVEQASLSVRAAQYEVDRALEQYDLVDPKNRLVADTLEERLDRRLQELREAQERLQATRAGWQPLSAEQREALTELGQHFETVWNHPDADVQLRKRLVREAIEEIVLTLEPPEKQSVAAVIHWQGGVHTQCHVHKRGPQCGGPAAPELVDSVRQMAEEIEDAAIVRVLKLNGYTTPRGLPWTLDRLQQFRKHHRIRQGQPDPELLSVGRAAKYLDVCNENVEELAKLGLLDRNQVLPYAPWRIRKEQLDSPEVRTAINRLREVGSQVERDGAEQLCMFPEDDRPRSQV